MVFQAQFFDLYQSRGFSGLSSQYKSVSYSIVYKLNNKEKTNFNFIERYSTATPATICDQ